MFLLQRLSIFNWDRTMYYCIKHEKGGLGEECCEAAEGLGCKNGGSWSMCPAHYPGKLGTRLGLRDSQTR